MSDINCYCYYYLIFIIVIIFRFSVSEEIPAVNETEKNDKYEDIYDWIKNCRNDMPDPCNETVAQPEIAQQYSIPNPSPYSVPRPPYPVPTPPYPVPTPLYSVPRPPYPAPTPPYSVSPPVHENNLAPPKNITFRIFRKICSKFLAFGSCRQIKFCKYVHSLPYAWEETVQNMSVNDIGLLYDDVRNKRFLFIYKKIFKYVCEKFGQANDFTRLMHLSKDVMNLNMDVDTTPFIVNIIKVMEKSDITFQSAIDLVFKCTNINEIKKNTLADILLCIIIDHNSCLEDNWVNIQTLVKNRDNLDMGLVKDMILIALKEPINSIVCKKICTDVLTLLPDDQLQRIFYDNNKFLEVLKRFGMEEEVTVLINRCNLETNSINESSNVRNINVCNDLYAAPEDATQNPSPPCNPSLPQHNLNKTVPLKYNPQMSTRHQPYPQKFQNQSCQANEQLNIPSLLTIPVVKPVEYLESPTTERYTPTNPDLQPNGRSPQEERNYYTAPQKTFGNCHKKNLTITHDGKLKNVEVYNHTRSIVSDDETRYSENSDFHNNDYDSLSSQHDSTTNCPLTYIPTPIHELRTTATSTAIDLPTDQNNPPDFNFQNDYLIFNQAEVEAAFAENNSPAIFNLVIKYKSCETDFIMTALNTIDTMEINVTKFFTDLLMNMHSKDY